MYCRLMASYCPTTYYGSFLLLLILCLFSCCFVCFSHSFLFGSSLIFSTFGTITYESVFKKKPSITTAHDALSDERAHRFSSMTSCSQHIGLYSSVNLDALDIALLNYLDDPFIDYTLSNQSNLIDLSASTRIWSIITGSPL